MYANKMSSIRINLSMALITLVVLISAFETQRGVLAIEQKNSTDAKPEIPLWHISSTQSSVIPTSSSIAPSTSVGSVISSSQPPPSSSSVSSIPVSHNTARDEIYIDDEGLEGSGRGEIHDDLEKEPEYSGSGFGPDDEDSSSSTTHQRKNKGNAGHKSTNTGSGGHKSTNSKNQSQESILDNKLKKLPEKQPDFNIDTSDDLESGSGDRIDIDVNDDNEYDGHKPRTDKDDEIEEKNIAPINNIPPINGGDDDQDGDSGSDGDFEIDEKTDDISSKLKHFYFDYNKVNARFKTTFGNKLCELQCEKKNNLISILNLFI